MFCSLKGMSIFKVFAHSLLDFASCLIKKWIKQAPVLDRHFMRLFAIALALINSLTKFNSFSIPIYLFVLKNLNGKNMINFLILFMILTLLNLLKNRMISYNANYDPQINVIMLMRTN